MLRSIILIILLLMTTGCEMGIKRGDFTQEALKIFEILEISIEHIGFPQSEIENINAFYDKEFNPKDED
ncbi:hypothetical protein [Paenibacillus herberti]|uniref:Uncharacterized protein n=1 Tax=Paenibacillus herberti TaxID=1619309 RepID=A0A229NX71_9BACL|nr:hypothetical protein [Paenibacillus herberti]OXM14391.1 hypothetical protein CGZ75_15710 [Paenibacillus herberti]